MSKEHEINTLPGSQPVYPNKPLQEHVDDSYKMRGKPSEPSICGECGAVFQDGRWCWSVKPAGAKEMLCPACHRVQDGIAAGYIKLEGKFFAMHREEILNLVRHVEKREIAEHPLQRIMNILDEAGAVKITTTDVHLARGIGEAIHDAYRGSLELKYGDDERLIRVHWAR